MYKRNVLPLHVIRRALFGPGGVWTKYYKKRGIKSQEQEKLKEKEKKKMPLYEISERYLSFLKSLENGEIPDEALSDTLEAIDCEFDEKADSICCFIKNLNAEAEAIKKEIAALIERRTPKLKCAERLTEYLKNQMELIKKTKIETPRNKITVKKNPESVAIDGDFLIWARENADEFLKWKEP
ncbi:MAG: siphovirus Gp157 family protein, partial [Clostridiales Family XIII bacterium]|nr:siphovirus Gp157 family protein [Clostridiales Family XIII bacterium]